MGDTADLLHMWVERPEKLEKCSLNTEKTAAGRSLLCSPSFPDCVQNEQMLITSMFTI